jgi:hypothetical protein
MEAVIRAMHSKTGLISTVFPCSTTPGNGTEMSNFVDGLFWKQHPLVHEKLSHFNTSLRMILSQITR